MSKVCSVCMFKRASIITIQKKFLWQSLIDLIRVVCIQMYLKVFTLFLMQLYDILSELSNNTSCLRVILSLADFTGFICAIVINWTLSGYSSIARKFPCNTKAIIWVLLKIGKCKCHLLDVVATFSLDNKNKQILVMTISRFLLWDIICIYTLQLQ